MNTNSTCTTTTASATNSATKPSHPALDHDAIKAAFAASTTPLLCSEQAYRYAQLSGEATDHGTAMALESVSRAFHEQRHMLRESRDFGPASHMTRKHSIARDRALAEVGL